MSDDRIARGFDQLAPVYDILGDIAFAGALRRSQRSFLSDLPRISRALVIGGGTGRFLSDLLVEGRVARVVSVDVSPGMTHLASRRVADLGRSPDVEFRVGTIDAVLRDERFDLVVTHCYLDLFPPERMSFVVERLSGSLLPGGFWLFSDFSDAGTGPRGAIRRGAVRFLYRFFRVSCGIEASHLPPFRDAFDRFGLTALRSGSHLGGLIVTSLYQKGLKPQRQPDEKQVAVLSQFPA